MASPELAEKLAKRLQSTVVEDEAAAENAKLPPPPAPIIPQKIVENPYVEKSDGTSIDDLIFKALEKKEENNNNNSNNNNSNAQPLKIDTKESTSSTVPNVVDPRSPPPKVSILELIEKERMMSEAAQQSTPTPKTPVMVISKGAFPRSSSPRRQQFIRENEDGNELEKRLAAQRLKKYDEELAMAKSTDVLEALMNLPYKGPPPPPPLPPISSIPPPPPSSTIIPAAPVSPVPPSASSTNSQPVPITAVRSVESIEEEERRLKETEETEAFEALEQQVERMSRSPVPPPPPPPPLFTIPPPPTISPPPAPKDSPPPSPRPKSVPPPVPSDLPPPPPEVSANEGPAPEDPKAPSEDVSTPILDLPETVPALPVIPEAVEPSNSSEPTTPPPTVTPTPAPKPLVLPTPPPKPETPLASRRVPTPQLIELIQKEDGVRSPTNSRPQSPIVPKKPSLSSLGLMCDPDLSHEKVPAVTSPPPSAPPVVSPKPSFAGPTSVDETELNEALERRNRILEVVKQLREKCATRILYPTDLPVKSVFQSRIRTSRLDLDYLVVKQKINLTKLVHSSPSPPPDPYPQSESIPLKLNKKISLYAEFSEFSRKQIQYFTETFRKYDEDNDNFIDFEELKRMMEKLGEAQTHIALKELIKKVDEDKDGKISQREFLLIFRLAASGELSCSEVFTTLAQSVDVSKEGVLGAANFFQAKIEEQTKMSRFEEEMREEKEERRRQEEEKKARRDKFLASKSIFH